MTELEEARHEVTVWRGIARASEQRERIATDRMRLAEDAVKTWESLAAEKNWGYVHDERMDTAKAKILELERLLSRAYPWLHNPYHGTTDYANAAEGDAVIEAVQTAIQHVLDEPDPLLSLPCGSCDGTGKIETGDTLLACPNCTPIFDRRPAPRGDASAADGEVGGG